MTASNIVDALFEAELSLEDRLAHAIRKMLARGYGNEIVKDGQCSFTLSLREDETCFRFDKKSDKYLNGLDLRCKIEHPDWKNDHWWDNPTFIRPPLRVPKREIAVAETKSRISRANISKEYAHEILASIFDALNAVPFDPKLKPFYRLAETWGWIPSAELMTAML